MTNTRALSALAFGLVVLSACGGTPPANGVDAAGTDAPAGTSIAGTWLRDSDYGTSRRVLTITFAEDGTMSAEESFDVMTASTATNAGCASTNTYEGTWTATATMLTVTATSGTIVTTSCNDASMNTTGRPATTDELALFAGTSAFTVTSTTLEFTSFMDPAAFTRQ